MSIDLGRVTCIIVLAMVMRRLEAQPPAVQQPSPMVEGTRAHERLSPRTLAGRVDSLAGPLDRQLLVRIPDRLASDRAFDLIVHFHGAAWLAQQAMASAAPRAVGVVVNLGAGSALYDRAFADPGTFDSLLATVTRAVAATTGRPAAIRRVTVVGYSAGHGAIRAILRSPRHVATVDAVLLIDGLHTSYRPEGRVAADGGALDTTTLHPIADFARAAMRGEKRMLLTHSEIFPGTFASTTETTDWVLNAVGVARRPVLRWGPRGMQQLSEAGAGHFAVRGFAGNAAPDHVDQLHAMPELLRALLR